MGGPLAALEALLTRQHLSTALTMPVQTCQSPDRQDANPLSQLFNRAPSFQPDSDCVKFSNEQAPNSVLIVEELPSLPTGSIASDVSSRSEVPVPPVIGQEKAVSEVLGVMEGCYINGLGTQQNVTEEAPIAAAEELVTTTGADSTKVTLET